MKALVWLLFAWSTLWLLVMFYFVIAWVAETENPLRHENLMGYAIGLLYSLPSLILVPTITALKRKVFQPKQLIILNLPLFALIISYIILIASGAGPWL